jgi:hypothetical protein
LAPPVTVEPALGPATADPDAGAGTGTLTPNADDPAPDAAVDGTPVDPTGADPPAGELAQHWLAAVDEVEVGAAFVGGVVGVDVATGAGSGVVAAPPGEVVAGAVDASGAAWARFVATIVLVGAPAAADAAVHRSASRTTTAAKATTTSCLPAPVVVPLAPVRMR